MFGEFTISSFCSETAGILQYVGIALTIIKVAIPMIIIFLGVMDLGKAVIAEKQDETKAGAKRLLWRCIAGLAIFFIPSIVLWLFGTIADFNEQKDSFSVCQACLLHPTGGACVQKP